MLIKVDLTASQVPRMHVPLRLVEARLNPMLCQLRLDFISDIGLSTTSWIVNHSHRFLRKVGLTHLNWCGLLSDEPPDVIQSLRQFFIVELAIVCVRGYKAGAIGPGQISELLSRPILCQVTY